MFSTPLFRTIAFRSGAAAPLRWTMGAALSATLLLSGAAAAQEGSAENKAAARDLAVEGIKLAQAGNCTEAIPKLSRAEKLFHAPTILTWIGQCQIEVGRYVEGTENLNRVIREKVPEDAPEAYITAQAKARELIAQAQPKIGKLTIEVAPAEIDGVEVTVDERPMSSALIGAPKPSDPGTHSVTVTAPGYLSATQEIDLAEGGRETLSFTLEEDPNAAADTVAPAHEPGTPVPTADSGGGNSNWVGWTTVGLGGALLAGGGVMGYLALDKKNSLDCEEDGRCSSSQEKTLNQARTNATVSTVLFGVGGAALVTGIVLLATGKSSDGVSDTAERSVTPQIGLGSIGLTGRF